MGRKGKTTVILITAAGLAVLLGVGFAAKDRIREEWYRILEPWYLQQIVEGTTEAQMAAAHKLGEMKSLRAVPVLLKAMKKALPSSPTLALFKDGEMSFFQDSLVAIGKPATLTLIEVVASEDRCFASLAIATLERIYGDAPTAFEIFLPPSVGGIWIQREPILEYLRDQEELSHEIRQAAAEALKRIQGT